MSQMKGGAILSYLSILITIIIALTYTPIMIRLLGQSEYGLYALIGSFAAYMSILDMGLGNAIIRYNARNRVIGDKSAESKLNGMFLKFYLFIGLLTIIIGTIFYQSIDGIFGSTLTIIELEKAKIMVIILTINYALSFPLLVFGSIMQAYEQFIISKVVGIIRSVSIPLVTLPVLFLGHGAIAMVVITTIVNLAALLFNLFYCFKYLKVKFNFGKIDVTLLKEILGYSFFVFLGVIVDQIYWNTDQFILGAVAGTVPVAVYAIAMQFIRLYMQFSTSISGLFLPKTSMMVANNATAEELTNNMIRYGRIQFIIIAFIVSGFILFGQPFINIWAGNNYNNAYYITVIVMVPLMIPLIQNFGIAVLYAKNMQKFRSVVLIIIAILNVAISIPLARSFGGIGAAFATALSLSLGNILAMNIYYHLKIGINMIKFWKTILKMSIPLNVLLGVGLVTTYIINSPSLIMLILQIIVFSTMYLILLWRFSMNDYEKSLLNSIFRRMKGFFKNNKIVAK